MKCALNNFDYLDITCQNLLWISIDAVGIILLFITIILGIRATKAAIIAAKTAQQSMLVGQRAYMGVFHSIIPYVNEEKKLVGLGIQIRLKNHGMTPAQKIINRSRCLAVKYRDDGSLYDVGSLHRISSQLMSLQSNAEEVVRGFEKALTIEKLQALYEEGATCVLLGIRLEYQDVFGETEKYVEQLITKYDFTCPPNTWTASGLTSEFNEKFFHNSEKSNEAADFIWKIPDEIYDAGGINNIAED